MGPKRLFRCKRRREGTLDESKVLGEPTLVEDRPKQLSAVELVDELLDRDDDAERDDD